MADFDLEATARLVTNPARETNLARFNLDRAYTSATTSSVVVDYLSVEAPVLGEL